MGKDRVLEFWQQEPKKIFEGRFALSVKLASKEVTLYNVMLVTIGTATSEIGMLPGVGGYFFRCLGH